MEGVRNPERIGYLSVPDYDTVETPYGYEVVYGSVQGYVGTEIDDDVEDPYDLADDLLFGDWIETEEETRTAELDSKLHKLVSRFM